MAGRGTAVIAGAGIYFLMIGAVWGYLEGIAREAGLTLIQTGQALSLGLLVSLIGAGAAAWLGLRFGRVLPLIASCIIQAVSLYLLTRLQSFPDPLLVARHRVGINVLYSLPVRRMARPQTHS